MNYLTQKEKLLREQRLIISEIQSLQNNIDLYNKDLEQVRKLLVELDSGQNDNAWLTYSEMVSKQSA
jgi:prefoldin subunit 5